MKTSLIELSKRFKVIGLASLLLFGLSTLQSCKKEGCTDSAANNYDEKADEDDGSCTYDRDAFIGSFSSQEACNSGNFSYTMTIANSSTSKAAIILNNLGDFGQAVTGTVTGTSLTIASQTITVQGTAVTISGTGALNGNTLTINYTASVAGVADSCTITAIRS